MVVAVLAIGASALLLALADPAWLGLSLLAWLAFGPWLFSLQRMRPGLALLSGFVMGLAFSVPLRWPTFAAGVAAAGESGAMGLAWTMGLFSLYGLPFALFGWIDAAALRSRLANGPLSAMLRSGLLASLICTLWVPFPFTPASLLASQPLALQIADLGGEPLLLWVMLWPSVAAAQAFGSDSVPAGIRSLWPLVPLMLFVHLYGAVRLQHMDRVDDDRILLSALPLQLDLPRYAGIESFSRDRAGGTTSAIERSRRALEQSPACELVIWPEVPLSPMRAERLCQLAQDWSERLERPLLLQCARRDEVWVRWTAELFEPGQADPRWHAKSDLLPLYERPLWSRGSALEGEPGSVFHLDESRALVPALCFELHSRRHLRHARLDGGRIVVHMASFTPFGRHPVDRWDLAMAKIRAVEFRMPIIRSANRGPVGWIDAAGRAHEQSDPLGNRAACIQASTPRERPPPHVWLAPFAGFVPAMPLLLFIVFRLARRFRRNTQAN